ncbi:hypothetical protein NBRC116601_00450 [Cognatishimia sp. WU-CL00825]
MKYAFVAEHRPQFSVRAMCRCLCIHPSGFNAWIKDPLSHRAREDARQTKLLKEAWQGSGKVYGYRKLHDDWVEQGETSCPNRVARLTRLAGIRAQIGYKRKPGKYSGRPSVVVDNTLDRQFEVAEPDPAWVSDITYIKPTRASCIWPWSSTSTRVVLLAGPRNHASPQTLCFRHFSWLFGDANPSILS